MPEVSTVGVLITAFGGPDRLESVGPFMRNLMGREPSAEMVERAQRKYAAIGACSPLPGLAARLAEGLELRMAEAGRSADVRVGMRYWRPPIAGSFAELVDGGARRVVALSLSPFESAVSSGAYRSAVAEAAGLHPGVEVTEAPSFFDAPDFIAALAQGARDACERLDASNPFVVFTAHSLPADDAERDPAYVVQLRATAAAVAASIGLPAGRNEVDLVSVQPAFGHGGDHPWVLAYQSRGMAPGRWLGPAIEEVIEAAAASGHDGIAACPIGFATDHMETLYDLDVVAAEKAREAGLAFVRAAVPNASPLLVEALFLQVDSVL